MVQKYIYKRAILFIKDHRMCYRKEICFVKDNRLVSATLVYFHNKQHNNR